MAARKSTVIGHDCNDHIRDTTKNTGHDIPLYY